MCELRLGFLDLTRIIQFYHNILFETSVIDWNCNFMAFTFYTSYVVKTSFFSNLSVLFRWFWMSWARAYFLHDLAPNSNRRFTFSSKWKIRQMETSRPMERFFPSRVIKSFPCNNNQLHFDKFFWNWSKDLDLTSTMVKKSLNLYEIIHSGQNELKLVLIKKYRSLG